MGELDFSGLLACYSDKGRTGFNPIMLCSVVAYANIQSEEGILKRQTRSIQTEGHFGDIKENETSGVLTIGQKRKYIKSSCCML